ncbi:MAG: hypothetical protein J0L92_14475 [Deltaproteobacteria bacterium]|nr:hypothetical protein [Deltaproteobacteria bacterium]
MSGLRVEQLSLPSRRDQDRLGVRASHRGAIVALADGAGGMAHGERAAELAIARVLEGPMDEATILALDRDVMRVGGETTLICVTLTSRANATIDVRGVAVGDSRAWARCRGVWMELTEGQDRRRLGSGEVRPLAFALRATDRVLLVSDGMLDLVEEDVLLTLDSLAELVARVPRDDASAILIRRI